MIAEEHVVVLLLAILLLQNCETCDVRYCEVSQWSEWSGCSLRCGNGGTQSRTRYKTVVETCGGDCHYELSEYRDCPKTCVNGGTPSSSGCACETGYTGSCCELGVSMKRNGHGNSNPSTQDSSDTKCGSGCQAAAICGTVGFCGICATAALYCCKKAGNKGASLIVNCICCNRGSVIHPQPNDATNRPEERNTANGTNSGGGNDLQRTPGTATAGSPPGYPCPPPYSPPGYDQLTLPSASAPYFDEFVSVTLNCS